MGNVTGVHKPMVGVTVSPRQTHLRPAADSLTSHLAPTCGGILGTMQQSRYLPDISTLSRKLMTEATPRGVPRRGGPRYSMRRGRIAQETTPYGPFR